MIRLRLRLSPDYLDTLATRVCVAVILACSAGLALVLIDLIRKGY